MSRTNDRGRRSKSARGHNDDPHHHQRRGAHKRRAWFAAATAIAAVSIAIVAVAGFVLTGDSTVSDRPPAIASTITISPDMRAQRAGLNVHRQPRLPLPTVAKPDYVYSWPTSGPITQGMTDEHPLGIDIDTGYGATIRTVRAGTVVTAGGDPCCSYGYHVIVEHADGWRSLYAHLSGISVAVGDTVFQGDVIGVSGATGKVTGAHLHFELQAGRTPVNPLNYLEPFRAYVVADFATAGQPEANVESQSTEADVASDAAFSSSAVVAETQTADAESAASLDAKTQIVVAAISTAIPWLEEQGEEIYLLNSASCYTVPAGPNWTVYCGVTNTDCSHNPDCPTTVQACVLRSLEFVAARCSGY